MPVPGAYPTIHSLTQSARQKPGMRPVVSRGGKAGISIRADYFVLPMFLETEVAMMNCQYMLS